MVSRFKFEKIGIEPDWIDFETWMYQIQMQQIIIIVIIKDISKLKYSRVKGENKFLTILRTLMTVYKEWLVSYNNFAEESYKHFLKSYTYLIFMYETFVLVSVKK